MSLNALQIYFEWNYYALAQKPDKLIGATLDELSFANLRKRLDPLEKRIIFCVPRLNTLNVSTGRVCTY